VSYPNIRSFKPEGLSYDYRLADGEQPSTPKMSRIRSISHFPQGMTPEIQLRLLERGQQRELTILQ
jgi:hypothetical protein